MERWHELVLTIAVTNKLDFFLSWVCNPTITHECLCLANSRPSINNRAFVKTCTVFLFPPYVSVSASLSDRNEIRMCDSSDQLFLRETKSSRFPNEWESSVAARFSLSSFTFFLLLVYLWYRERDGWEMRKEREKMAVVLMVFSILLSFLFSFSLAFNVSSLSFDHAYSPLFGDGNLIRSSDGKTVRLLLDRYTGIISFSW